MKDNEVKKYIKNKPDRNEKRIDHIKEDLAKICMAKNIQRVSFDFAIYIEVVITVGKYWCGD